MNLVTRDTFLFAKVFGIVPTSENAVCFTERIPLSYGCSSKSYTEKDGMERK